MVSFFIFLGLFIAAGACCCLTCICLCSLYAECFKNLNGWTIVSGNWTVDDTYPLPGLSGLVDSFKTNDSNAEIVLNGIETKSPYGGISIYANCTDPNTEIYIYFAYIDSNNWSRFKFKSGANINSYGIGQLEFKKSGIITTSAIKINTTVGIFICYSPEEVLLYQGKGYAYTGIPQFAYKFSELGNFPRTRTKNLGADHGGFRLGTGNVASGSSVYFSKIKPIQGGSAAIFYEPMQNDDNEIYDGFGSKNSCCECCQSCDKACDIAPDSIEIEVSIPSIPAFNNSICNLPPTQLTNTFILNKILPTDDIDLLAFGCSYTSQQGCMYYTNIGIVSCTTVPPTSTYGNIHAVIVAFISNQSSNNFSPIYSDGTGGYGDVGRDFKCSKFGDFGNRKLEVRMYLYSPDCAFVSFRFAGTTFPPTFVQGAQTIVWFGGINSCTGTYDIPFAQSLSTFQRGNIPDVCNTLPYCTNSTSTLGVYNPGVLSGGGQFPKINITL